jgi:hypothetical protein
MRNKVSFHNVGFLRGTRAAVWAALICLVFAAASCRTIKTVEVPVPIHDTTYVKSVVKDSVFVEHTTHEYVKGDTVFIRKTTTKYVDRVKTDTLRLYVEKPVEIVKTETKTVEKPLNWLHKTLIGCGVLFLASLFAGIVIFILGLKRR